jgi:phage baseplate assembly protein W|tara:strand:+ start:1340 stop:1780 length:441 start_codon:yes stop_codon:yes gene_type:complete
MSQLEKNLYKRVTVNSPIQLASTGRKYRGFTTVADAKSFSVYDFELIKQDLINHFHIRQTEKLSDPTFGTIIWDILYEPFTVEVQEAIIEDVTKIINYDPRIKADDVVIDTYEQGIQIDCKITVLPFGITDQLRFKFDKENGLLQQ